MENDQIHTLYPSETHLTLMPDENAIIIFIGLISTFICTCLLSFSTSNMYSLAKYPSITTVYPASEIAIRSVFEGFNSLNSYVWLSLNPAKQSRSISYSVTGKLQLLDSNEEEIEEINISTTGTTDSSVVLLKKSTIKFASIVAFIDISSTDAELNLFSLTSASQSSSISTLGIVMISIFTILLACLLIFVISRRVKPTNLDHWFSIFLCGVCFLVDGPWILFQYFAVSSFSQIFDAMPQIFHSCFIIFVLVFFGVRSVGILRHVFRNFIIHAVVICMSIILISLQFYITDGQPLATFPFAKKSPSVLGVLIVIFAVYHITVIVTLIIGFTTLRIDRAWPLMLVMFSFCILEVIHIATFLVRIFIGTSGVGFSFAIDLVYILEANIICCLMVYIDTPICYSKSYGMTLLGGDSIQADLDDIE